MSLRGLRNGIALVTGAAGGIGSEIVRRLLDEGAAVYAADLCWNDHAPMSGVTQLVLDVTDAAQVRATLEQIIADRGSLDFAVNGAGLLQAKADWREYDGDDWDRMEAVNARGLFLCLKAELEFMTARGAGAVVNIASIAGRDGRTLSPPYAASKAAVINLTRSFALLAAPDGVRVNAVAPGIIDGDFNLRIGRQFGPSQGLSPEEFVRRRAEGVPLGRIGEPSDIAGAVCLLLSDDASYITGQTVNVDGGMVMC